MELIFCSRPGKHKNMFEMLNDKTDVNNLRDMYTKLSLVEYIENVNEYEDEYDDTYDDIDTAVGNEGNTEVEERYVQHIIIIQNKVSHKMVKKDGFINTNLAVCMEVLVYGRDICI